MIRPHNPGPAWDEWKRNRACAPRSLEVEAYEAGRRDGRATNADNFRRVARRLGLAPAVIERLALEIDGGAL